MEHERLEAFTIGISEAVAFDRLYDNGHGKSLTKEAIATVRIDRHMAELSVAPRLLERIDLWRRVETTSRVCSFPRQLKMALNWASKFWMA